MKKRYLILSVLLTLALVFTMMPAISFAGDEEAVTYQYFVKDGSIQNSQDLVAGHDYLITVEKQTEAGQTVYDAVCSKVNNPPPSGTAYFDHAETFEPVNSVITIEEGNNTSVIWKWGNAGNKSVFKQGSNNLYFGSPTKGLSARLDSRATVLKENKLYADAGSGDYYFLSINAYGTVSDNPVNPSSPDSANVTMFRQAYKVDFDLNGHGGSVNPDSVFTDVSGNFTRPDDPTDSSWEFIGWSVDPQTKPEDYSDPTLPITNNTTFFAVWKYDQAAVDAYKEAKVAEIANTDLSKYKAEQQAAIKSAIASYTNKINDPATLTIEDVDNLVKAFNAEIAALPTAAQIDAATTAAVAGTPVVINSVTAGKKKITVKWTANAGTFDGYEIQYRVKGKKKWKSAEVADPAAAKKVIKKLKKGKKYQAKVRGYKMVGAVKVYGQFSKTKTTKKKVK